LYRNRIRNEPAWFRDDRALDRPGIPALAAGTLAIAVIEFVGNGVMLILPGAMEAG
jgi:hypothetical protein